MSIAQRQETPRALELLAAQRQTYSRAKVYRAVRVATSAGLAVLAPIVALASSEASVLLAGVGAAVAAAAQLLGQPHEKRLMARAAHIQDQFDSLVFGLTARRSVDVVDEETAEAARACSTKDSLTGWYTTTEKLPPALMVLMAQRSSLVWNLRQRKRYATFVGVALAAVILADLVIGSSMPAAQWMLALVFPSFAGFVHGIEVIRDHTTAQRQEAAALDEVERIWRAGVLDPATVTPDVLRGVQDRLLRLRSEHAPIPDWIHRRLRGSFEVDAKAALDTRVADFEAAAGARSVPVLEARAGAEGVPVPVGATTRAAS